VATARACARAGLRAVELTHSTPDVETAVRTLSDDGLTVGVGTVTSADQVAAAAAAGAGFVVSYTRPAGMIAMAHRFGLLAIPGALTPTEVFAARSEGAEVVKLFPAHLVPPTFVGDLRAVMPGLALMATGGLSARDGSAATWLAAGALAVGLGSEIGSAARDGAVAVAERAALALAATRDAGPGR
jgi:2-dehydro-3-deoxyphosphogluconate aldolase/(4S)-4-hydroxy-2-oxoglutarate aldolase